MPAPQTLPTPESLNLIQIMEHFSTDDKARAYLEAIRWPDGPFCPHCGNADGTKIWAIKANPAKKIRAGLRQCRECKRQFTVTIDTIFESTKIPLRKWIIAWYLLCSSKKGISALQIQRQLGLGSYRTAWFMMHRIREALRQPEFAGKPGEPGAKLDGTVEVDETWVGGKARGAGRGGWRKIKTPVVAMAQRGGAVRSRVVEHVRTKDLKAVMLESIAPTAQIMTDDNRVYWWPKLAFAGHEVVNHSKREYARGSAHVNTAESYFGLLKRGIIGTFHHISRKHLHRYLAEFDYRWSWSTKRDGELTTRGIELGEGKRLKIRQLLFV